MEIADINLNMASVHLIDEEKHFANDLDSYIDKCSIGKSKDDSGLNYHIISVFGSQSTGKSTLLNRLFGTHFDVMDEEKRQQTTKGIWFSHANYIASTNNELNNKIENNNNIFVLDVEGVDGRERADDKDFERKSALFALATSEILIVNIFEHQVGLYQGANMELLKTVMEVNLSLFYKQNEKCLLLFVIRDFTGLTPLSNLGTSLQADMDKIWADLNKPEECKDSKLEDFFDLEFFAISHKHYQPEKFEHNIKELGDSFSNDSLFKNNKYHKKIPIDAWALYSKQIWDQIENNKDLDLPTQQILVSKFKCNEISNNIYNELFFTEFNKINDPETNPIESCEFFKNLRLECISSYDNQASRYKNNVYIDIRKDLIYKIDEKLKEFQSIILKNLTDNLISKLDNSFITLRKVNHKKSFQDLLDTISFDTLEKFKSESSNYKLDEEDNEIFNETYRAEVKYLEGKLNDFINNLKRKESNVLVNKLGKKFQLKFKDYVIEELTQPTLESWDNIAFESKEIINRLLKPFKLDNYYDFKIGLNATANESLHSKIEKNIWDKFDSVIHDFVNDDSVSRILRNNFEDSFKFDATGLPLIWKDFNQLDSQFNTAKNTTLKLLPILSSMKLSNGKVIQKPKFNIVDDIDSEDDYDSDSDQDENESSDNETENDNKNSLSVKNKKFATLLTKKQQAKVLQRFKRETDAVYFEAKRSMVANKTSIPTYIYILIIILGWNEFMIVLKNPFLFILTIMLITGFYLSYSSQMLGPIISVGNAMFNQSKVVIRAKLRDALLDDKDKNDVPSEITVTKTEEAYELNDL
jgi:hypothetical protein